MKTELGRRCKELDAKYYYSLARGEYVVVQCNKQGVALLATGQSLEELWEAIR